jgi:hypothetical protein
MAGSITVSSITLDSDNNFSIKSNTGATLFFANTTGIDVANSIGATAITNDKILSVANTKISGNIISSQITSVANTQITGNIISSQITSNPTLYGNVSVTGVIGVGGATPSTSGSGITFPATQSASTNANTLDDYEEGTWTPTLNFGGGSTGITYGGQLGTYVKIGKLVWLNCRLTLTAKGSSTGSARVAGLPFTNQGGSTNGEIQVGAVWYNTFNNASNYHINLRQDASAAPDYMEFRAYSGGSEAEVNQTWFNNGSSFSFTIFSMVTA